MKTIYYLFNLQRCSIYQSCSLMYKCILFKFVLFKWFNLWLVNFLNNYIPRYKYDYKIVLWIIIMFLSGGRVHRGSPGPEGMLGSHPQHREHQAAAEQPHAARHGAGLLRVPGLRGGAEQESQLVLFFCSTLLDIGLFMHVLCTCNWNGISTQKGWSLH